MVFKPINKAYDAAIAAASGKDSLNTTKRYNDLVTAAKIATTDQAVTPLYEGRSQILMKSHLRGVVFDDFNGDMNLQHAYVK